MGVCDDVFDERDENEREREVIVMKDDVDEMNNTCVVVVGKHD